MYVCKRLAAAQRPVLLPAAPLRLLPQTVDLRGRTPLLSPRRPRGPGGQKHPGGTNSDWKVQWEKNRAVIG